MFRSLLPQLTEARTPPTLDQLQDVVSNQTLLVARDDDGRILGTLTFVLYRVASGVKGRIEDVIVDESARGQGVGETLVREGMRLANDAGVLRLAGGYQAIGIDEVQFFDDGIVGVIGQLVDRGARVVAAGLAQDFRGLPFGPLPELLAHAEFVDKLQAVCHRCGGPATMTQRLVDGQPAPADGATIVVGALDSYEARCRACFEPGIDAAAVA